MNGSTSLPEAKNCYKAKRKLWQRILCSAMNPSSAWNITKTLNGLHIKAVRCQELLQNQAGVVAENPLFCNESLERLEHH